MVILDAYTRRARLIPGLIVVLPVAVAVTALGLQGQPVVAAVGGLLMSLGGPFVLASVVRTQGLALQDRLFAEWGGAPTTQALRNRGNAWPDAQRLLWRAAVGQATEVLLPNEHDEAANSLLADGTYESAVARLRALERDKRKFPLVFEENRNFGYERNLLGMRPSGLVIAVAAAIAMLVIGVLSELHDVNNLSATSLFVAAAVDAAIALFWLLVPSKSRTLLVARRYAERLLEGATELAAQRVQSEAKTK